METKICKGCGKEYSLESGFFYKDNAFKDGYKSRCKICYKNRIKIQKIISKEGYKICTKCQNELLASDEYFKVKKGGKYGLDAVCKDCQHDAYINKREYYINKSKKYYEENKETILEKSKDYNIEHKKDKKIYDKEYAIKNKGTKSKYAKEYVKKNKEKIEEYRKKYYKENKERITIINNRWKLNNLDRVRIIRKRRKNKKKTSISTLTVEQWQQIKQKFKNKCAYCGKELPLEQDHFIPLSKGGEYTINNIVPACRHCNASKNNSNFLEWYPKQEFYSKKRENKVLKYLDYKNKDIQQLKIM